MKILGAVLGTLLAAASITVPAAAEDVEYFPMPGSPAQTLTEMAPSSNGGIWIQQQLRAEHDGRDLLRFIQVDDQSGSILSSTANLYGYNERMFPASDGGLWTVLDGPESVDGPAYQRRLTHISESGVASQVALPRRADAQIDGRDGNQWVIARNEAGDFVAFRVTAAGDFAEFALNGLKTGDSSSGGFTIDLIPTETGIWIGLYSWRSQEAGPRNRAMFVSYDGDPGTAFDVPVNLQLRAPAPGDRAWWIRSNGDGDAEMGWLKNDNTLEKLKVARGLSGLGSGQDALYVADAGRNGGLVWSQDDEQNREAAGQIGSIDSSGKVERSFLVDSDTVKIELEDGFLSGDCYFGSFVYQAADGSLWASASGRPSRIIRTEPDGESSLFVFEPSGITSFNSQTNFTFGVESRPDSLWLLGNSSSGPVLAKLNPLEPPLPLKTTTTRDQEPDPEPVSRARVRSSLGKSIATLRRALRTKAGSSASFSVPVRFVKAGTMRLKVELHSKGRRKSIGSGSRTGPVGKQKLKFKLNRLGVKSLRAQRRRMVRISGEFRIRGTSEIVKRNTTVGV